MSETSSEPPQEGLMAPVYGIKTGRLLFQTFRPDQIADEAEALSSDKISPVANIRTGKDLTQKEHDTWIRDGEVETLVFWERSELPDNVVPLEDGRLNREVRAMLVEPPRLPYASNKYTPHRTGNIQRPTDLV